MYQYISLRTCVLIVCIGFSTDTICIDAVMFPSKRVKFYTRVCLFWDILSSVFR